MDADWCFISDGVPDSCPGVSSGRKIEIPECTADGVARFDFGELCDRALGPKDYLAIAREHHTIFLHGVPMMNMARRDQARRLISLIDALYECNTKLYCRWVVHRWNLGAL